MLIKARNTAKDLKILTPKQMFQKLLIALAQAKAEKTSENLLKEMPQVFASFFASRKIKF